MNPKIKVKVDGFEIEDKINRKPVYQQLRGNISHYSHSTDCNGSNAMTHLILWFQSSYE